MKQKCNSCGKWFKNVVLHCSKAKKCCKFAMANADNLPDNIAIENESINDCNKDNDSNMNENQNELYDQPISFSDSHESYDDCIDFHDNIDLGFAIPSQLEIVAKQNELLDNYYSRLEPTYSVRHG